jgi:hypothetical protein
VTARCLACRPSDPCEKHFTAQVSGLARLQGWRIYHPWTSVHSQPGWPDLVLVRDSIMLCVELKRNGRKPTPAQEDWLDALEHVETVKAFCWRPSDWPLIEEALRR